MLLLLDNCEQQIEACALEGIAGVTLKIEI